VGEGERADCDVGGCDRKAAPRCPKCWGHLKQLQRYGRTYPLQPRLDARQALFEAALELAPAEGDQDFERAERRFWDAFRRAAREASVGELVQLVRFTSLRGRERAG
jgi:hypothetical protein